MGLPPHPCLSSPIVEARSYACSRASLQISLERMLKIEAQSSSTSRRRFSVASSSSFHLPSSTSMPAAATTHPSTENPRDASSPSVLVTIVHSPLHVGCFFQPSPTKDTSTNTGGILSQGHSDAPCLEQKQQKGCSAFSLASPACAHVFPLRRCDWEGGGGGGAGAALFAAAAAVEGAGGGGRRAEGHVSAEEVPREERLRYK